MNFAAAETIANAVLFEGYILYPYRPSAIKNRQRWNFGTLYPRAFAHAQAPQERWQFEAEILFEANEAPALSARLRFLQLVGATGEGSGDWQTGFPRSRTLKDISLEELVNGVDVVFELGDLLQEEITPAPSAYAIKPCRGRLSLRAEALRDGLYRLHACLANESSCAVAERATRRDVQDIAFTSAHLLLGIEGGSFESLLEPAEDLVGDVKACRQDGVFPVLVGETGDRGCALCSPIILYDYPQIARESPGDFFDGTEMDEMLALRVLTLTDAEKAEMRKGDPHARDLLERTESLPDEHLARLHGAVRGLREITQKQCEAARVDLVEQPFDPLAEKPPLSSVRVFGVELHTGDRVRVWPQKRADILDIAMEGRVATIEAIEQDLESNIQFAVVLDDDPGRDLGMLRQPGHRFFFTPEEVEPLEMETS
jgi:hypothetical protein